MPDINEIELIPEMTSNTTPSGVASASSHQLNNTNYAPYNAFDRKDSTWWISTGSTNEIGQWLQYEFDKPKVVTKLEVYTGNTAEDTSCTFELSGSNDGSNFVPLKNISTLKDKVITERITNNTPYKYYRLTTTSSNGSYYSGSRYYSLVRRLQLYGH